MARALAPILDRRVRRPNVAIGGHVACNARRRDQYLATIRQTLPVNLPVLEGEASIRPPFCYQPARPVMLVKAARGYALNLANSRTRIAILYFAGLAAIFAWRPVG